MTMSKRFDQWWENNNYGDGYVSLNQIFEGGWRIAFHEQQEASNLREKLILDELRLHLPEGFDIDKAIVSAVTKG